MGAVVGLLLSLVAVGPLAWSLPVGAGRVLAWGVGLVAVVAADGLTATAAPLVRMLALIATGLAAMKVAVAVEEVAAGMRRPSAGAWLAFLSWAGMRPRVFVEPGPPDPAGARALAGRGAVGLGLGLALLAAARTLRLAWGPHALADLTLLAGCSATLHFGVLNLLGAAWRHLGVACDELFAAPWRAEGLGEFWGRRWNRAFSAMTATVVYRPASARLGRAPALLLAFGLSGVLHEMALSWPVRAGFGGPLAYFLLHGLLVLGERGLARRGLRPAGVAGTAWVLVAVLLPLGWLFHPAALEGLAWPLVGLGGG